jgi:TonB family protein
MNYFRSCAVLFAVSVGFSAQIISDGTKPNAVVPVLVHSRVSLKPCELVQRGSLVIATEYAWVEIEGEKSEIYSPEMGPGDYLSPSPPISGHAAKDARKSGFELRAETAFATDLPRVRALSGDADCRDPQNATLEVKQARALRRAAVQARTYRPGVDDIVAASMLKSDQGAATNRAGNGTGVKMEKQFEGNVALIIVISTEGTMQQCKIVRSVNPEADKKAVDEVSRWKFTPARKKGLPVPSTMPVEINFKLY